VATASSPAHTTGMTSSQPRQPAGSTEGGQFAPSSGAESTTRLADGLRDADGATSVRSIVRAHLPLSDDPALEGTAQAIADAVLAQNRSELDSSGNIHGTFTTARFDTVLDDELVDLPADCRFGQVAETTVDYADSGAVMTTFRTTDGTEVVVEIVDQDEDHGPIIGITTPAGTYGTYYSDGEQAWDDEIDGAEDLVRYGVDLHRRVMQAESAVRYAALEAARENIMAIATAVRGRS